MATKRQSLKKEEQYEACEQLRKIVKPGDRLYTILRHVSRSGMQRVIDVYTLSGHVQDGNATQVPHWIGSLAARAIGAPYDHQRNGIKVNGCGSDMGWTIVYHLGWALFGKEWPCTGNDCPSNVHINGDRDYTPGRLHGDGGYALRQSWL